MDKREIEFKINVLLDIKKDIENRINELENELNKFNIQEIDSYNSFNFNVDCINKDSFFYYLTEIRGLRAHSANNYIGSLKNLKLKLYSLDNIELTREIYDISDINELEEVEKIILNSNNIMELNKTHHNQITAAFNRYKEFLDYVYNDNVEIKVSESFELDE